MRVLCIISTLAVQCRHLISALSAWAAKEYYTTARPIATLFPWHGCVDDLTIEHSFDSQATWVIGVIALFVLPVFHGCKHNPALADAWSTGAGIKCPPGWKRPRAPGYWIDKTAMFMKMLLNFADNIQAHTTVIISNNLPTLKYTIGSSPIVDFQHTYPITGMFNKLWTYVNICYYLNLG